MSACTQPAGEEDGLAVERRLVQEYLLNFGALISANQTRPRRKSPTEAAALATQAEQLFRAKHKHNSAQHQKTWDLLTRCVATAPSDSAQLARAYCARAAFTFHLREYDECIRDCERGLKLGAKLEEETRAETLVRRVECLALLRKPSLRHVAQEALQALGRLQMAPELRRRFECKLAEALERRPRKKPSQKREPVVPPAMQRNPEAPCASSAVAIAYSSRWGRHVVATRRIEPGEVSC